jgi:hypothetical protein
VRKTLNQIALGESDSPRANDRLGGKTGSRRGER